MDFYRDITFTAPSASLTNFPVLVRIRGDRMIKRISSPQGYDVAFRQGNTDLDFELDFYDASTGSGAWWVQVPQLPDSDPTKIRMLYGDSSIETDQSSPTTVWSNYLAVYHFNSTGTSQQFNSAAGTYDTWSEAGSGTHPKSVALANGGATGKILAVTQYFDYDRPATLSYTCSSVQDNLQNVVSVMETNKYFGTPDAQSSATLVKFGSWWINNTRMRHYSNNNFDRQTAYTEGTLEYMNASWQYSDKSVAWQINDQRETGILNCTWISANTNMAALYCYRGSPVTTTYKIDELRFRRSFASQAESEYEKNILMHYANYVTWGPECYSNGTRVPDDLVYEGFPSATPHSQTH